MTTRTTTIRVNGDRWDVPRGFGEEYLRTAREEGERLGKGHPGEVIGVIRDLLGLIGYDAPVEAVADWPARKRIEAVVYARNVHARASDNPIQPHPKLDWLPEPWRGPETGEGVFAGPGGTVLGARSISIRGGTTAAAAGGGAAPRSKLRARAIQIGKRGRGAAR